MCVRQTKPAGKPFAKGHKKFGGRTKGTPNKISKGFLEDMNAAWCERGQEVIDIMMVEEPATFAKIMATLQTKNITINNPFKDVTDEQIAALRDILARK